MNVHSPSSLHLPLQNHLIPATITLEASKSISNRVLILDALCKQQSTLENLSEARDTQIMLALLNESGPVWDAQDAGTTLRFLTAYGALTGQVKEITGTSRMQHRPIKILVDALREIGADIEYIAQEGFPPIQVKGFAEQLQQTVTISGDVSSQYLSALLMMAPSLPQGLILQISGKLMSRPYVNMTLKLMQQFGIDHQWEGSRITISPQQYQPAQILVEADWSAASYWYSMVALGGSEITLLGLQDTSLQGDRQIANIMEPLGVHSRFHEGGVTLIPEEPLVDELEYDFSNCPDLAQTVLSLCAVTGITCRASGLESLYIKETDRIAAMQCELGKVGAKLEEQSTGWLLTPTEELPEDPIRFHTYEDHRMAMALAPLALRFPLIIEDPLVVNKSYPSFWQDLAQAGLVSETVS
ncbi:MAG: 3-phosphoshikimate 1-carboxyvinyltransferase [Cyclobacteriaceae bacterium]|nr:3-phosphoshikimate 1-carboxyvinyltransferase [Cyclobacteriaceae bacterium]